MNLDFLFWFFLVGIILATVQDLKRREIDHWLNAVLLAGGIAFVFFYSIANWTYTPLLQLGISLLIFFGISNLFYYGRVFGGGDSSLVFALSALFVGAGIIGTITNIFVYLMILLFSGAIYGTVALLILYTRNIRLVNKDIWPRLKKIKYNYILLASLILVFMSFFHAFFGAVGIILALYPLLYHFAKTLDEKLMVKSIPVKDLREGDWLAQKITVKNKKMDYNWHGLSNEEVRFIQKNYRGKVKVKEGLPFAPAFLIAHVLYWVFAGNVLLFLGL